LHRGHGISRRLFGLFGLSTATGSRNKEDCRYRDGGDPMADVNQA
jgi:hypothetical protein